MVNSLIISVLFSSIFYLFTENKASDIETSGLEIKYIQSSITVKSDIEFSDTKLYFSDHLYRSYFSGKQLFLNDENFCRSAIFDDNLRLLSFYDSESFAQVSGCPQSIMQQNDTSYVYHLGNSVFSSYYKDKYIGSASLNLPDYVIGVNRNLPTRLLPNKNILVPIADNVMENPNYYKEHFDLGNLKNYMKKQFLFGLYDINGELIKEFGKFPEIFLTENIKYASPQSYFYSIIDNSIFVTYPICDLVQEYDFTGQLIKEFKIPIKGFNYSPKVNYDWNDSITGFSTYKNSSNQIGFYFFTFQMEGKERKQMLHQFDIGTNEMKSAYFEERVIGMILSEASEKTVKYLGMSWEEEPLRLMDLSIK